MFYSILRKIHWTRSSQFIETCSSLPLYPSFLTRSLLLYLSHSNKATSIDIRMNFVVRQSGHNFHSYLGRIRVLRRVKWKFMVSAGSPSSIFNRPPPLPQSPDKFGPLSLPLLSIREDASSYSEHPQASAVSFVPCQHSHSGSESVTLSCLTPLLPSPCASPLAIENPPISPVRLQPAWHVASSRSDGQSGVVMSQQAGTETCCISARSNVT